MPEGDNVTETVQGRSMAVNWTGGGNQRKHQRELNLIRITQLPWRKNFLVRRTRKEVRTAVREMSTL